MPCSQIMRCFFQGANREPILRLGWLKYLCKGCDNIFHFCKFPGLTLECVNQAKECGGRHPGRRQRSPWRPHAGPVEELGPVERRKHVLTRTAPPRAEIATDTRGGIRPVGPPARGRGSECPVALCSSDPVTALVPHGAP